MPVTPTPTEPGRYLFAFGANEKGQLGLNLNKTNVVQRPSVVNSKALMNHKVKMVACGTAHTLVCTEDGLTYSWGSNKDGQLGLGDDRDAFAPVRIRKIPENIVFVACGDRSSAAITEDGLLYTWGSNKDIQGSTGSLGYSVSGGRQYFPGLVEELRGVNVKFVALGYMHGGCITEDGSMYTWGRGTWGRLGLGDTVSRDNPCKLTAAPEKAVMMSCAKTVTAFLGESGKLYVFGKNDNFLLGPDSIGTLFGGGNFDAATVPINLYFDNNPDERFSYICLGEHMGAAVTASGEVWNWGRNVQPPRKAKGLSNIISCDLGRNHQGYVSKDGELIMMGENWSYQLGTESSTFGTSNPHKLNGEFLPGKVKQVACGYGFTLCVSEIE